MDADPESVTEVAHDYEGLRRHCRTKRLYGKKGTCFEQMARYPHFIAQSLSAVFVLVISFTSGKQGVNRGRVTPTQI